MTQKTILIRATLDPAPEGDGAEFQAWCKRWDFDPLGSDGRAWCGRFNTYLAHAVGVAYTGSEVFLVYPGGYEEVPE